MKIHFCFILSALLIYFIVSGPVNGALACSYHHPQRERTGVIINQWGPYAQSRVTPGSNFQSGNFNPHFQSRRIYIPLNPGVNLPGEDMELARWPIHKRTLNVYMEPGNHLPGYSHSYPKAIFEAMREWTAVLNGKINFQLVQNPRLADLKITWVNRLDSNRQEVGKTYTITRRYRGISLGEIESSEIKILSHINGRTIPDMEMKKIALHELGHALGIQGHSSDPRDIMYHSTSPYQSTSLTYGDINTVQKIYVDHNTAFRFSN